MVLASGYLYELLRELGLGDFGARTGEFLLVRPLKVVAIFVVAIIATRLAARAISRSLQSLHARSPLLGASPRADLRATTITDVLLSAARVVIWSIAMLVIFDQLGINLAPLLAGAGIAGIALGFGAQTLVRDVISGLFILVEDQYGVGDTVELGDTVGTVEEVNLRVTRVRSVDGKVWFVPNGEVRRVGNASREWSRAVVDVPVPVGADIGAAVARIRQEAAALAASPEFADVVDGEPEVWGVEAMTADTVTVRVAMRTAAQQQARVARALRGRVVDLLVKPSAPAG